MTTFAAFVGIGPSQALIGAARRLRIPFEPAVILERIEGHAEPRSLLALVEAGSAAGFALAAFEAAWEDLSSVTLPAIVHLEDAASGESAFAVLVEVEPDGVVLENPASRAEQRLPRDAFAGLWSGVLVTIARGERAAAFAEKGTVPLSVGAEPHAWARVSALVLVAGFALTGGLRGGAVGVLFAALTLTGTVIGALLLSGSRKTQVASAGFRLASALCKRGTLTDCEGVLSSKWARIGPFELATWGFAFFASCALMFALRAPLPWLAAIALLASPLSIFLIGVQLGPLKRICTLCMAIHAIVLAGAIAGIVAYSPTQAVAAAFPWAFVHAAAFLFSLGILAPYIEMEIENRTHRARLDWMGTTPWGSLAEYAGRPGADLGLIPTTHLGGDNGRFRLDVLVHITCKGCPPLLEKLERLARRHPDLVRIDLHFPSRDTNVPEDGELCVALAAIGTLVGGEQLLRVFELVKQDPWKRMETAKAGAPAVLREFLPPEIRFEDAIEDARRAVGAATTALDLLKRGTPQLVLAGRPWDGSVEDLETLMVRHPEAVEEAMA